jgi:DNA-binding transcriptional LysR family regulator
MRTTLEDLEILDRLLSERSLTHTAQALQISQPAVSKALAKMRRRFADPLFVRVGLTMEPTNRALELQRSIRDVLVAMRRLNTQTAVFAAASSQRTFRLFASDAAVMRLVPPLVRILQSEAPGVLLHVVQVEPERLHSQLESGDLDFALGPFPALAQTMHRQRLFTEGYMSAVRREHPRLSAHPTYAEFCSERHVIVSAHRATFVHREVEQAIVAAVPPQNIVLRTPGFAAAAMVAKHTDAVATLPSRVAEMLAGELGLQLVRTPLALPRLPIGLYWHERAHRDAGNKWMRALFYRLFSQGVSAATTSR